LLLNFALGLSFILIGVGGGGLSDFGGLSPRPSPGL